MRLAYFCQIYSLIGLLYAPLAMARLGYTLKQTPITLGFYDSAATKVAKISPDGKLFGQIDSFGNAHIWAFDAPNFPALSFTSNPAMGQIFVDLNFSSDGQYIIFDSTFKNTGLNLYGKVVVFSTKTFIAEEFDTYVFGGTKLSKYALSNTGLFAYATGHGNEIAIFDLRTRIPKKIVETGFSSISALAFDPLAQKLAIKDITAKTIRIRDVATGALLKVLALAFPMPDDAYSPDQTMFYWGKGSMLAVNSDQNLFAIGDAQTSEGQFPFMWYASLAMFISNDTKILAVADATFTLNIQRVGDPTLYQIEPFGFDDETVTGAFSPRDQNFALGSASGAVAVYDAKLNFQCGSFLTDADEISQIAYVNERQFLSVTAGNMLTRWDIIQF